MTKVIINDKMIKSSKEDKQKKSKEFKKTSKKCLTERIKHDKIRKSLECDTENGL